MRDLFAGPWGAQRFLIVPPRHGITLTSDDTVIKTAPLAPPEHATAKPRNAHL